MLPRTLWIALVLVSVGARADAAEVVLALTDDERAIASVVVDLPGEGTSATVQVRVTTRRKQRVKAVALGEDAWVNNSRWDTRLVRPDEPWTATLRGRPGTRVALVAFDEKAGRVAPSDVFLPPDAQASLESRALDRHSPVLHTQASPFLDGHSMELATFAGELFGSLPRGLIFAGQTSGDSKCRVPADEPLILVSDRETDRHQIRLLRANGELIECALGRDERLSDFVTLQAPARWVMPAIVVPPERVSTGFWADEDLMTRGDEDRRIAQYKAKRAEVRACTEAAWQRLDPDGRAGDYDLVTFGPGGKVKKVESYADKLLRKVDASCRISALFKERDAIRAGIRKTFSADMKRRIEALAERLEREK